jgi:hypothetical protein
MGKMEILPISIRIWLWDLRRISGVLQKYQKYTTNPLISDPMNSKERIFFHYLNNHSTIQKTTYRHKKVERKYKLLLQWASVIYLLMFIAQYRAHRFQLSLGLMCPYIILDLSSMS